MQDNLNNNLEQEINDIKNNTETIKQTILMLEEKISSVDAKLTPELRSISSALELNSAEIKQYAASADRLMKITDELNGALLSESRNISALESRLSAVEADNLLGNEKIETLTKDMSAHFQQQDSEIKRLNGETGRLGNLISSYHDDAYLNSMDYAQFENRFRGPRDVIMESQRCYIPYFKDCKNVYDLGCGRGEFVELLTNEGIPVTGVDLSQQFVDICTARGLNVRYGEAIQALRSEQEQIDGIFCSQMAEHISKAKLLELCRVCYSKLKIGGYVIFETPNVRSLITLANSFYLDPTHDRPVHPELFRYFLDISGFKDIQIIYTDFSKQGLPKIPPVDESFKNAEEMNKAINSVNNLLFNSQDYAIIARK